MSRKPTSRRGRPRDPATDQLLLKTTRALLREKGYGATSIEGVARAAGVAKTTIYRRWPGKSLLVWHALFGEPTTENIPDTGDLRQDLRIALSGLASSLGSREARAAVPGLLEELGRDTELRDLIRERLVNRARDRLGQIFDRAADRGELHTDVPQGTILAALAGALVFRSIVSGLPLEAEFIDDLVELTVNGIAPRATT